MDFVPSSYKRLHGDLSKLKDGLTYDEFLGENGFCLCFCTEHDGFHSKSDGFYTKYAGLHASSDVDGVLVELGPAGAEHGDLIHKIIDLTLNMLIW